MVKEIKKNDISKLIEKNVLVDEDLLVEVFTALKELRENGVRGRSYDLELPFTRKAEKPAETENETTSCCYRPLI